MGTFAKGLLDIFDDTLEAIYRISKGTSQNIVGLRNHSNKHIGKVKVIIAPHDAHGIRKTNNIPCDAYCDKLNGTGFLDFYSASECKRIFSCSFLWQYLIYFQIELITRLG